MLTLVVVGCVGVLPAVAVGEIVPAAAIVNRISGADRYSTTVIAANSAFGTGADTVVIANGEDPVGPRLAASLAGAVEGPVLLSRSDTLPASTRQFILDAGVTRVIVIDGPVPFSAAVISALEAVGATVERISYAEPYSLAATIAARVASEVPFDGEALIVSGEQPFDYRALQAVGAYAFSQKMPILLSSYGGLPTTTTAALESLDVTHCVVAGDEWEIPAQVDDDLTDAGRVVTRVNGYRPEGLAAAMARYAIDEGWASPEQVVVTGMHHYAESAAGAFLAGARGGVVLLTNETGLSDKTQRFLYDYRAEIAQVTIVGSSAAIPNSVAVEIGAWAPPLPERTVSGTVRDVTSVPVEGVTAYVFGYDASDAIRPVSLESVAHSGLTGTYTATGVQSAESGPAWYWTVFDDPQSRYWAQSYRDAYPYPTYGDAVDAGPADVTGVDVKLKTASQWAAARVQRLSGADRYSTCLAVSRQNFAHAETVVIATGADFPDALAASALAGLYKSPLLLTKPDALPSGLTAELARLGCDEVVIVGGAKAVSASVEKALASAGYPLKARLAGTDRYDTAARVYRHIVAAGGTNGATVPFVVRGDSFPDALAASPFAWREVRPVLLVRPTSAPAPTMSIISGYGINTIIVIGGTSAVGPGALSNLAAASSDGIEYYRFAGTNRYETAAAVARAWGGVFPYVGVASGLTFPDALAGGAACGARGGALLLTSTTSLATPAASIITASRPYLWRAEIFGGTKSLSNGVRDRILSLWSVATTEVSPQDTVGSSACASVPYPDFLSNTPDTYIAHPSATEGSR